MRRTFRRLLIGVAALVLSCAGVAGGGFLWLRSGLPQTSGTIVLEGPFAPIEIRRDAQGVPHIAAADARDAAHSLRLQALLRCKRRRPHRCPQATPWTRAAAKRRVPVSAMCARRIV